MSTLVTVRRAPVRTVLVLLAGLLLLLAAYDIVWGHVVSGPPSREEVSEEQAGQQTDVATVQPPLTTKGESERRTDLLWGTVFTLAGAFAVGGALLSLLRRPVLVEVTDDALRLRINGPGGLVDFPWEHVSWVHSGVSDDDEATPARVLLVHVDNPGDYTPYPWGAVWDGGTLMMDADSWQMPPEDVVNHARIALDAHRREAALAAEAAEADASEPDDDTSLDEPGRQVDDDAVETESLAEADPV